MVINSSHLARKLSPRKVHFVEGNQAWQKRAAFVRLVRIAEDEDVNMAKSEEAGFHFNPHARMPTGTSALPGSSSVFKAEGIKQKESDSFAKFARRIGTHNLLPQVARISRKVITLPRSHRKHIAAFVPTVPCMPFHPFPGNILGLGYPI